jgi:DNA-directed RNA polymerase subunit RPC12/RpoP
MELWKECMLWNPSAWKTMERYNRQDVVLLEKLYYKLLPWISSHPNKGIYVDDEVLVPTCTNCGSSFLKKEGKERLALMTYQRYRCKNCGKYSRGRKAIDRPGPGVIK